MLHILLARAIHIYQMFANSTYLANKNLKELYAIKKIHDLRKKWENTSLFYFCPKVLNRTNIFEINLYILFLFRVSDKIK